MILRLSMDVEEHLQAGRLALARRHRTKRIDREVHVLYPVCVHQDGDGPLGATIPDFPGCFSGADDWSSLPDNVREAVKLYCSDDDVEIPTPSCPTICATGRSTPGALGHSSTLMSKAVQRAPLKMHCARWMHSTMRRRQRTYRYRHTRTSEREGLLSPGPERVRHTRNVFGVDLNAAH